MLLLKEERFMKKMLALVFLLFFFTSPITEAKEQTVLARVMEKKVLRCGYIPWEPYLMRDLKTNKLNGITYDYINSVASRLGIKVDWAAEILPDQIVPSIQAGKIDMFCVPCSPIPEFEKQLDFIGSFGKLPYFIYVANDKKWSEENISTARFSAVDGYIPLTETPKFFPKAKLASLPQTTSMGELYDQIKFGKSDVVINEHLSAINYMKTNPNIIKRYSDNPLFTKPMSFPAPKNDPEWKAFIDKEFDTKKPENRKILESLMKKYGLTEDILLLQ
jgi:ABC-type amino acid transport substrate-binding protein